MLFLFPRPNNKKRQFLLQFYGERLVDTAPVGDQWSSYPGIKDTQVSEKYL